MGHQTNTLTRSRRLADGPATTQQAIDYGLSLAQELKRRHQAGAGFGSLHPDLIGLNGAAAFIEDGPAPGISRYSAPEQWEGQAPDARSDVFAFGSVFYELLTGRPVVEGDSPEEWRASFAGRDAALPNGIAPELARLIDRCLNIRPEERWQHVSAIVVELKLLAASHRHAKAAVDWKRWLSAVQTEIDERLAAHRSEHHAALGDVHRTLGQLASRAEEHSASAAAAAQTLTALAESISSAHAKLDALDHSLHAAHENLGFLGETVNMASQKLAGLEESVSAASHELGALDVSVRDLNVRAAFQHRAIESIQSAVAQTDEVLDHVVDAFDSMHRIVIERADNGTARAAQRSN
jgi:uncharacterized coiled-coil protein SlyX